MGRQAAVRAGESAGDGRVPSDPPVTARLSLARHQPSCSAEHRFRSLHDGESGPRRALHHRRNGAKACLPSLQIHSNSRCFPF
jgi:hypothetical protein